MTDQRETMGGKVSTEVRRAERVEREAWLDLFDAASADCAAALGLASRREPDTALLASTAIPSVEFNRAIAGAAGDADVAAATAWLTANAAPCWTVQWPLVDPDAASTERLEAEGLASAGPGWAKFVRGTDAASADFAGAGDPLRNLDVLEVGRDEAAVFGRLAQQGFGLPEASADWLSNVVGRAGWTCFVLRVGGEPAAIGAMFVKDRAAWFGVDATLPSYQGLGGQSLLIASRMARAATDGCTILTAETARPASDADRGFSSFRNYGRARFEQAYARPNYRRGG